MKLLFILLFIFFSKSIFANDEGQSEIEVINLYDNKSLDQMVLDNLIEEQETEEVIESSNETIEITTNEVEETQIEFNNDNFIFKNDISDLKNYLNNLQYINSKTLQKQFIEVLENLQLNLEIDKDKEIFFLIINYLKSVGQINKSYELIDIYVN